MPLHLKILQPGLPDQIAIFPDETPVVVGRGERADVRIDHSSVSRSHLVLLLREGCLYVEDLSTNGTLVGEEWLRRVRAEVQVGTELRIGPITIEPSWSEARIAQEGTETAPVYLLPGSRQAPSTQAQGQPTGAVGAHVPSAIRERAHSMLLRHLDLVVNDPTKMDSAALRPRVVSALRQIVEGLRSELPPGVVQARLIGELADEALGLGPLEQLLADPEVSEIMVVDASTIFVERSGICVRVDTSFTDDARVRAVVERIVTPLGRRIDESQPLVDARLRDGSRVNAVIRPLALRGTCITIRKFPKHGLTLEGLEQVGSLSSAMARFLTRSVKAKKNIVVAGGTGSGKTTLLNILSSAIGDNERIITIEDAAELQMRQPHVVALETRPANLEGVGAYTIRDLVRNALRMRPDRIVVGECRAGEAFDMLQAMNTGHEGSLTTVHANTTKDAVARLETLCLMAGLGLPLRAIREQIASSVHLIVQQQRLNDGSRKVVEIAEVEGMDRQGEVRLRPLFRFTQEGQGADGRVLGSFGSTGYLPSYLDDLFRLGLIPPGEALL